MDYQSDDIVSAYRNLIAAKETLFEAFERELDEIENFNLAMRKAILEQSEEDKSSRDVKEARLLDKIGNEYNVMQEAKRDKRMALYDHEIAKARTQLFRDLIEWKKEIPTFMALNASHEKPREKTHDKTSEVASSDHKELIQVSHM
jgi:hypothetical protein